MDEQGTVDWIDDRKEMMRWNAVGIERPSGDLFHGVPTLPVSVAFSAWLPIIGPTAAAFMLIAGGETGDHLLVGEHTEIHDLAQMFGVTKGPFVNGLARCSRFGLVKVMPAHRTLLVPVAIPFPSPRQRERWPMIYRRGHGGAAQHR